MLQCAALVALARREWPKMIHSAITFDGMDCTGKTTQIRMLKKYLDERFGDAAKKTKLPNWQPTMIKSGMGHSRACEKIKAILRDCPMNAHTEALLFAAALSHGNAEIEELADDRERFVDYLLVDRSALSLVAYQCGGRGLSTENWRELSILKTIYWRRLEGGIYLNLLLDAPAEIVCERIQKRGNADRIERESVEFFKRVREKYLEIAHECNAEDKGLRPPAYHIVDATKSIDEVHADIVDIFEEYVVYFFMKDHPDISLNIKAAVAGIAGYAGVDLLNVFANRLAALARHKSKTNGE